MAHGETATRSCHDDRCVISSTTGLSTCYRCIGDGDTNGKVCSVPRCRYCNRVYEDQASRPENISFLHLHVEIPGARYKPDLLDCTTSLTSFSFGIFHLREPNSLRPSPFERGQLNYMKRIITSSTNIKTFQICLRKYADRRQPEAITTRFLLGNDLSRLSKFRLQCAVVSEDVLKSFLTACKNTLTHISIHTVRLVQPASEWRPWLDVFRNISDVPVLQFLYLSTLNSGPPGHNSWVSFDLIERGMKPKGKCGYRSIELDGRDDVVAGVRELLS
jgi:hypothetical protein